MNSYFGYIRVSTVRQGERGSSLIEQKSAIEAYAGRNGLTIAGWFEEMETAAKQGRRLFNKMLVELGKGRARGVIIHKIDRSARNLKDWAHLGELIDAGVEVHFAHEAVDLTSRGGRLSADIQAVVAADYIRNLRDEVKKGFYGRLKQGFYPLPAPLGYLDRGKATAKVIDPVTGPLVREAFELYAGGEHSLQAVAALMAARGLRTRRGGHLSKSALAELFHNPFYIGLIHVRRTGEIFAGAHEPLIGKSLYDRVQAIAQGKVYGRGRLRFYAYRQLIGCGDCGRMLVGERQKGRVYYRCHRSDCGVSLREDRIDAQIAALIARLAFTPEDLGDLRDFARDLDADAEVKTAVRRDRLTLSLSQCEAQIARLTDAYLEATIDKVTFELRKARLLGERQGLKEALERTDGDNDAEDLLSTFELANTAYLRFSGASAEEKRDLVKSLCSNLTVRSGELGIGLRFPFDRIVERPVVRFGGPHRSGVRTLRTWFKEVVEAAFGQVPEVPDVPSPRDGLRPAA